MDEENMQKFLIVPPAVEQKTSPISLLRLHISPEIREELYNLINNQCTKKCIFKKGTN